ncbi:hypothetical protein VCRA2128O305_170004 [Vibrio crassostreae]|nr:hypothetical protein VCRA2116O233_150004 [Vibrio crassostreae]CAK1779315.1 hypothetical protein VCRA2113O222_160122 [Vibrio crassostreae]CAK1802748.1 hypothetical protein VCRA2110O175_170130 [Vibrio crassostreae]CAK1805788.1 hypothetical protein VCRA2111O320_180001 [Vibrio crassostreae]CAK1814974.1 hypothetical protein VCRA2113O324_170126 [Vibrio crassostreae]
MTKKYPKRGSSIFKYNYATKPIDSQVFHQEQRNKPIYLEVFRTAS